MVGLFACIQKIEGGSIATKKDDIVSNKKRIYVSTQGTGFPAVDFK